MFDANIYIRVGLGGYRHDTTVAWSHINLREDYSHKRWHVSGAHDHRFPGTGHLWLNYRRNPQNPKNIILYNKFGHEWAELENFPTDPQPNDAGTAYISNINHYKCPTTPGGRWFGDWRINKKAKQNNIQIVDPNASYFRQAVASCTIDSGWRFDTSSGVGASGGAGLGGGVLHTTLVFKRKEASDTRRWDLKINAIGAGLMTPGAGVSGSTEDFPSTPLMEVCAAPDAPKPFGINDFEGGVVLCDIGGGIGMKVAGTKTGGAGYSTTSIMFVGGYAAGVIPDMTTMKACLQIHSAAGAGGGSKTLLSAGLQGILYYGNCTVHQR